MNIYIQLTIAGTDVGPFDLYTDVDGFVSPYWTGISRADLIAGYNTTVPDGATQVKLESTGSCTNSVIIDITILVTTTTTTSSSTTTSTTSSSTTTTTTTSPPPTTTTTTTHAVYQYLGTTSTYSSANAACLAATCSRNYFRNTPVLADGLVLYDDAGFTTPFNGGDQWIAINAGLGGCSGAWYSVQVNAYGVMVNFTPCS